MNEREESQLAERQLNPAESMRDLASMMDPDPRYHMLYGQSLPSVADHHAGISRIQLSSAVPESIAIQFETARNLYLYAWHVYRFHMVAVTQALSTLEFALRERLPDRLPVKYQGAKQKQPMLFGMLGYAIDQGLVCNAGFRRWHAAAALKARERRSMESIQTMIDQQLESMEIDESELISITPEDQCWDLVNVLRETLPSIRNQLAHGSTSLTDQVLGELELVAEILSQLYPP